MFYDRYQYLTTTCKGCLGRTGKGVSAFLSLHFEYLELNFHLITEVN